MDPTNDPLHELLERKQTPRPDPDPLEILLTWDRETRKAVRDALRPYIWIDKSTSYIWSYGEINKPELYYALQDLAQAVRAELVLSPDAEKHRVDQKAAMELVRAIKENEDVTTDE